MVVPWCPPRRVFSLPLPQLETGSGRDRTTQRGRSPLVLRALVRMRTDQALLSGQILESGAGHCYPVFWRAIAPLMKPWCAEEEVPTAANLNLYWGWRSCAGWHCDDEFLFGECGEAKLIVFCGVLVALQSSGGNVSPVRMMKDICAALAVVTFLSWMVNVRMSSCIVRIPVGNRERINVTFRWVKTTCFHPVPCLGQEWHVVCQRVRKVFLFLFRSTSCVGFDILVLFGFF